MDIQEIADEAEKAVVLRITETGRSDIEALVVRESPLTIVLDNQELVTVLCSPVNLKYLAVGFLFSEGLLESKGEIKKIIADERKGIVWIETKGDKGVGSDVLNRRFITSGCGRGASFYSIADAQNMRKVESHVEVSSGEVFALVDEFQHHSEVYKATHGVHSAALCDRNTILIFSEDIGRHNALDKIFGECILKDMPTDDRIIIVSGRISSEMLLKVARRGIPVIVSIAVPTNAGVKLAADLGITLIGFVRGKRMNIYAGAWRITD